MIFFRMPAFFILTFLLLLNFGCASLNFQTSSHEKISSPTAKAIETEDLPTDPTDFTDPVEEYQPIPNSVSNKSEIALEDKNIEIQETESDEKAFSIPTDQELIDSALGYCEASNEFWDKGELDDAIDCLDKAWSYTLKISDLNNPEITQQKEDLRTTISRKILEVYTSRHSAVNGSHKAIPMVMNSHVQKEINLFKGREKKWFLKVYARSGKYRPAIVKELKKAGLPEELSWLPFIESGYNPTVQSSARALGMWQFIATTGYKFGLKRNTWMDERMDPEKSTQAAIAYLTELHNIFGEWTTALASYNCGENRVLRVIKSQKISYMDNFWDLYQKLPRETARYVPRFYAVLTILNDPEAYGFDLPPLKKELVYEKITVNKQMLLKTLAKSMDEKYSLLKALNPGLLQNVTPKTTYTLNVPKGKGKTLMSKIKDIPVYNPPLPAYVKHRVRNGESLSVIADKYNSSIRSIMNMNGIRSRNKVRAGRVLKIPTGKYTSAPRTYSQTSSGTATRYTVRKGDSLWKIANRFGITVKSIKAANNLRNSRLQIGQTLMLSKGLPVSKPGESKNYIVRRGDSPYLIAKRHRMNLYDFLKINNLTANSTIFPGQKVKITSR